MSHLLKITLIGLACFGFSACKETTSPQQASRDTGITTVDMGMAVDKGPSGSQDATQIRDVRVIGDAGRQVNDASTPSQDDATVMTPDMRPQETPPYGGLGMVAVDSPLYLTPAHLGLTVDEDFYVSIPVNRPLPRLDGMGDTSHLQPWLMYRPSAEEDGWIWLMMAFYLPADDVVRLPGPNARVQLGRSSAWHKRTAMGIEAVQNDIIRDILANGTDHPICGGAHLAARFVLKLPDGGRINDVVGVLMPISKRERLNLGWLRGCGRQTLP